MFEQYGGCYRNYDRYNNKFSYSYSEQSVALAYARTLLFLTREGKGLDPVIEAYNIYLNVIDSKYQDVKTNFTFLESDFKKTLILDNLLVIANYLSEQTGDTEYISRAWSALSSINSSILNWNILNNRLIRQGDKLAPVIRENRERKKGIFAMTEAWRNDYDPAKLAAIVEEYDRYYETGDYIIAQINERGLAEETVDITEQIAQIQQSYLTDSSSILLFNTGSHKHCLLINQDTIIQKNLVRFIQEDQLLDDYRNQVGDPGQSSHELGYQIYSTFLKELKPYLNEQVAIISGDEFETFPFVALPTDSTEQSSYLGDEHTFTYHHSLKIFRDDQKSQDFSDQNDILALAPQFNTTVQYASRRTTDGTKDLFLTPLHYNSLEVKELKENYPGHFYFGDEADKEKFLQQAPDHRVIHLATHAVADIGDGEQSALFLDYSEAGGSLEQQSLKAGEISNLILDADLVTLSACETGLGTQLLTEGTMGLTRAFTSAGARSILSTLWAVDDRATSEIVMDFYGQLDAGKSKSTALANAQQNFRIKHAGTEKDHPYYWAPFILVGNNAPLTDLDTNPLPWFWIITAVILLASLPVLLRRAQTPTEI